MARAVHQPQDAADIRVVGEVNHGPVAARDEYPVGAHDLLIAQCGQVTGMQQSGQPSLKSLQAPS